MVIDLNAQSDQLSDIVYYYHVDLNNKPDWETFKMCYPIFWTDNDYHQRTRENLDSDKNRKILTGGKSRVIYSVRQENNV